MKWRTYGQGIGRTHQASRGVNDYRVRWNGVQGSWEAETSFELHGNMTPFRTLGFYRVGDDAFAACEGHAKGAA